MMMMVMILVLTVKMTSNSMNTKIMIAAITVIIIWKPKNLYYTKARSNAAKKLFLFVIF